MRNLLRRVRPPGQSHLNEDILRHYFLGVLNGLEAVHSAGFIYRDLKLDNVLVSADGAVFLTDFEFAVHSRLSPTDLALFVLTALAAQFDHDFSFLVSKMNRLDAKFKRGSSLIADSIEVNFHELDHARVALMSHLFRKRAWRGVSERALGRRETCDGEQKPETSRSAEKLRSGDRDSREQKIIFKKTRIVGSLEYMPVEVLWQQYYSASSDVWSLGFLLYDLFHGNSLFRRPHHLTSDFEIIEYFQAQIRDFEPRNVNLDIVSETAKDLLRRILRKNPYERLGLEDLGDIRRHPWLSGCRLGASPYLPELDKGAKEAEPGSRYFIQKIRYKFNEQFAMRETGMKRFEFSKKKIKREHAESDEVRLRTLRSFRPGLEGSSRVEAKSLDTSLYIKERPLRSSKKKGRTSYFQSGIGQGRKAGSRTNGNNHFNGRPGAKKKKI